jgi:hypothetical protein
MSAEVYKHPLDQPSLDVDYLEAGFIEDNGGTIVDLSGRIPRVICIVMADGYVEVHSIPGFKEDETVKFSRSMLDHSMENGQYKQGQAEAGNPFFIYNIIVYY